MGLGFSALVFLGGCNTFATRAEQKSETFNSLDPATKDRLHQGMINVGDTPDMVYIALGVPDAKRQKVTASGREVSWIYRTYYQDYWGPELVGYHRYFAPYGGRGAWAVYWGPIDPALRYERSEDNMRVTFMNGRVTAVEQTQSN